MPGHQPPASDSLLAIALNLTDGIRVDWERALGGASGAERGVLTRLRELEALGLLHATGNDQMRTANRHDWRAVGFAPGVR